MKTFKQVRLQEKALSITKKIGKSSIEITAGSKGFELKIDGSLIGNDFKSKKEAEQTAKAVIGDLGS